MRTDGVRVGSPVRDAFRVTAATAGLLAQALAVFFVVGTLHAPGQAWCGASGSCIDDGLVGAVVHTEIVTLAAELGLGSLWWAVPLWRRRHPPGVDEWWDLVAVRLPRILIAAGGASLLVLLGAALLR